LKDNRLAGFLAQLAPPHQAYRGLKKALAAYRELAARGEWPDIGNDLEDWETNASQATLLRNRLALEDPVLTAESDLRPAILRFQQHHGLAADGRVGPRTMQALSVPPSERAAQIAVNMERWRWVPSAFGPRYILVNAADATLVLIDIGKVVLTSRVIVGKPATPTAMFGASVTDVTVNPFWNIPASIVRNEILPKARRNPGYLADNHIVSDGEGGYRQMPGADNALGRIKFEMPNRFSAYLHDTSAPALFARDERHLSHGCIRVQQIRALGSFALTGDPVAGLEKIDAAIESGETQRLALDAPLPVYVLYWTAIANGDGTVDFRPDVYGRDQELLAALAGRHLLGRVTMNYDTECRKA
jgi:murein L,D-transpeptidase YcbB/YkuD